MKIKNYITNDFKALRLDTSIADVKSFFKILPFTHFPIVENRKLIGMLAQADISHLPKDKACLCDFQHLFELYRTTVPDGTIDLIGLFAKYDTDIIPVVNEDQNYIGYFELDDILQLLYNTPFFKQNSTSLLIEKGENEYSMSEIAQIIESNNVDLLGMFVTQETDESTQISIRVGTENVNEIIQSLRRYEYKVLTNNKDDALQAQLQDRADYLKKYLEL